VSLDSFVEKTVDCVRGLSAPTFVFPEAAVVGSIYSGAAGVALFLHEAARARGEPELLHEARGWLDVANAWSCKAEADWRGLPRGFLIGEPGLAYVEALLYASEGDWRRVANAVARIDRLTELSEPCSDSDRRFRPSEVIGGAAGVVCLARDLDARLPRGTELDAARSVLACVRDRALASIATACETPIGEPTRLGVAHGVAGELLVLIQAVGAEHPHAKARLAELAGQRSFDDEGLVFWPQSRGKLSLELVGSWCNGVAGHCLLWTEVARQTGSAEALELARLAAESTFALPEVAGSLCCGMTGHALALQRYADVVGDSRWKRRAYERLVRATAACGAIGGSSGSPDLGLWQGPLGVAMVAMRRLSGNRRVPFLEPADGT
jgi:lantibiotic modifying enzyme